MEREKIKKKCWTDLLHIPAVKSVTIASSGPARPRMDCAVLCMPFGRFILFDKRGEGEKRKGEGEKGELRWEKREFFN